MYVCVCVAGFFADGGLMPSQVEDEGLFLVELNSLKCGSVEIQLDWQVNAV